MEPALIISSKEFDTMKESEIRNREVFNRYLELSAKDIVTFFSDRSKFEEISCPACNSKKSRSDFKKNDFHYVECNECRTLYVSPRPSVRQLQQFYADSPSTHFWVNDFFKPVAEARREKIFKPRAEFIAERFGKAGKLKVGDIGAGFGLFLEELKKFTPHADLVAIEPSEEMAAICTGKGISVIQKMIEDVQPNEGNFDLLTSFELFEHLHEPEFFVKKVFDLLKPGGHFVFTTLSGMGFDIQLLWDKSKSISPPHHLNFFNPHSVRILMERTGFKIIEIATPGKLDWSIVEGAITEEGLETERFWHNLSRFGDQKAKEELQTWISGNNFSSHMRTIVQRAV